MRISGISSESSAFCCLCLRLCLGIVASFVDGLSLTKTMWPDGFNTQMGDRTTLVIKAKHKEELHRWQMELAAISYDAIQQACAARFGLGQPRLQYRDEDGDMISMHCQADVEEALTQSNVLLYLVVEHEEKAVEEPAAAAAEQEAPSLEWCVGSTSSIQGMLGQAIGAAGQSGQLLAVAQQLIQAFSQQAPATQNAEQPSAASTPGLSTLLSAPVAQ